MLNEFVTLLETNKRIIIWDRNEKELFFSIIPFQNKMFKLPLVITPKLSFLAGCIIGDGHLSKERHSVIIEMVRKDIMEVIRETFCELFSAQLKLREIIDKRPNRKLRWRLEIKNKGVWLLFTKCFGIPSGKKSHKIDIKLFLSEDIENQRAFISGLFLADGGIKGKGRVAFSFSNKDPAIDIIEMLKNFGIRGNLSDWIKGGMNKHFFDVIIYRRNDVLKFFEMFPITKLKINYNN